MRVSMAARWTVRSRAVESAHSAITPVAICADTGAPDGGVPAKSDWHRSCTLYRQVTIGVSVQVTSGAEAREHGSGRGWIIGAIAVLLVAGLLFFQFRKPAADAAAGAVKTVTIAGIAYPYEGRQVFSDLTGVVIREGWLRDQLRTRGVSLAFTPVPTAVGGPLINEGFSGRRIDFAAYGDFPATIAVAGGVPLKLVMPVGQGRNTYLVVREGLPATSIADLKGKRIALHRGRPWELPFSKLVDTAGLKLTDFTIVNINPSATPAALASSDVDAAFLMSDGLLAASKGAGRIVWSTKQAPPDWRMRAELFGRGDFVGAHPDLTQLVVDAYVRAAAWSSRPENENRVIRDAAQGFLPEAIIRQDYDGDGVAWRDRFSPLFTQAVSQHYRSVADYTYERGLVRTKVDTDGLIDRRFVAQALKDQNLQNYWQRANAARVTAAVPAGRS
jgi:sulfonate transport system substrate-binding protein